MPRPGRVLRADWDAPALNPNIRREAPTTWRREGRLGGRPFRVTCRPAPPGRTAVRYRGVFTEQRPEGVRPGGRRVTTTRRPGESLADQGHGRTAGTGKGFPSRPPAKRRAGRHGEPATPRAARGERRPERPLSYHDGNRGRFPDRREEG